MSWLKDLIGKVIKVNGTPFPDRRNLHVIGTGISASDDPTNEATILDFSNLSGGGGTGDGDFLADGSVPMTGNLDLNFNDIINAGLINGIDIISLQSMINTLYAADPYSQYLRIDGTRAMSGDFNAGGYKITDVKQLQLENTDSLVSLVTYQTGGINGTTFQAFFGAGEPGAASVPANAGDYYFRSDGDSTGIYIKTTSAWLKLLDSSHLSATDPHPQYAPLDSPAFINTPTAPTVGDVDDSTLKIANTAFVQNVIADKLAAAIAGISWKNNVRVATTGPVNIASDLEAGDIVDGELLEAGDYVLVKDQTDKTQNGPYVVQASGAAIRRDDSDESSDFRNGATVRVEEGSVNAGKFWTLTAVDPIVIGTTDLEWTETSSGSAYTASNGIKIVSNDIRLDYSTLSPGAVSSDDLVVFWDNATSSLRSSTWVNYLSLLTTSLPFLRLTGGTMAGPINMGGNAITNASQIQAITTTDQLAGLVLQSGGLFGTTIPVYVGTRSPVGNIHGSPGSFYFRGNTTNSTVYIHKGAVSDDTSWVELGSGGSGSGGSFQVDYFAGSSAKTWTKPEWAIFHHITLVGRGGSGGDGAPGSVANSGGGGGGGASGAVQSFLVASSQLNATEIYKEQPGTEFAGAYVPFASDGADGSLNSGGSSRADNIFQSYRAGGGGGGGTNGAGGQVLGEILADQVSGYNYGNSRPGGNGNADKGGGGGSIDFAYGQLVLGGISSATGAGGGGGAGAPGPFIYFPTSTPGFVAAQDGGDSLDGLATGGSAGSNILQASPRAGLGVVGAGGGGGGGGARDASNPTGGAGGNGASGGAIILSFGLGGGTGDVSAHEAAADPHTQYSLINGTRAFTAPVGGVAPTADAHLTTKAYVDQKTLLPTSLSGWIYVGDFDFSDFAAASMSNDIEIYQLPQYYVLERVFIQHTQSFVGAGITSYAVTCGITGELDRYVSSYSVDVSPDFVLNEGSDTQVTNAFSSIRIGATSTGANLSAATAGIIKVWLQISDPKSSDTFSPLLIIDGGVFGGP